MTMPANKSQPQVARVDDRLADNARDRGPVAVPAPPNEPSGRAETSAARDARPSAPQTKASRGSLRAFLMLAGIALVAVASAAYWQRGGRWISTDDAYIRAPKLMVSTDISGIVATVDIVEGQRVKAGDVLFRVDPKQFEIALGAANAQLANIKANLTAARLDYAQLQSGIAAQEAQVALADINNERAAGLARTNSGSKAALDQARFTLDAARNQLQALRRQSEAALVRLGGALNVPVEQHPQYLAAASAVDEARRQFDHTIVRAPFAGIVTAVDKLQPGTFLVSQTAALTNTGAVALVATEGFYIEANVKETDLTFIKVGDPVNLQIDAYPGRVWTGSVDSISPASGAEFSILPAQNASGNWVKVVQRVPLRLKIDQMPNDPLLRAGMSVIADIDTGHQRHFADLWPSWLPTLDNSNGAKR